MTTGPVQLLVYSFPPGARFEGQLAGALERLEAGGALRILEAMFVRRDPSGGGEITALDIRGSAGGGLTAPLLSWRLDPGAREKATQRAMSGQTGVEPETLRELSGALEPGAAMAAVLVEHVWGRALADAVARTNGTELASEWVDATAFSQLADELVTRTKEKAP
jgi:hypothetical protein